MPRMAVTSREYLHRGAGSRDAHGHPSAKVTMGKELRPVWHNTLARHTRPDKGKGEKPLRHVPPAMV